MEKCEQPGKQRRWREPVLISDEEGVRNHRRGHKKVELLLAAQTLPTPFGEREDGDIERAGLRIGRIGITEPDRETRSLTRGPPQASCQPGKRKERRAAWWKRVEGPTNTEEETRADVGRGENVERGYGRRKKFV